MTVEDVFALETQMWEAAKSRNVSAFLDVVSDEAIMVCGGYRCTGKEYSKIIPFFDCKSYSIVNFEIVHEEAESIQIHYVIKLEVHDEKNNDLAGKFHITTTWKMIVGKWKVIFNMNQKVIDR